eukprot:5411411-Lingulodinium_polyedra.AAC.1
MWPYNPGKRADVKPLANKVCKKSRARVCGHAFNRFANSNRSAFTCCCYWIPHKPAGTPPVFAALARRF